MTDLIARYRNNDPMTLDERAEAQRLIVAEYRRQFAATHPLEAGPVAWGALAIIAAIPCDNIGPPP